MKRIGLLLICAAVGSVGAIAVRGTQPERCCGGRTIYDPATWWLIVLLAAGAIVTRFSKTSVWIGIGTATCLAIGPQLLGTGLVAYRRWYTSGGYGFGQYENLTVLRAFALLLASVGLAATLASLFALHRHAWSPSPDVRIKGVSLAVAAVMIVTLPYFMGHGRAGSMTVAALGAHALMYGFPWGLSFALSGWLEARAAITLAVVLPVSALPLLGQFLMIWAYHPTTGFGMAGLGGAAIVLSRWPQVRTWLPALQPPLD